MRLWALVRKEVLLLRAPHALAVLFIMPPLFLLLMAGAMSSYMQDKPPALRLILEAPGDDASQFFREALQAQLADSTLLTNSDERLARVRLSAGFSNRLLDSPHQGPSLNFPAQFDKLSSQRLRSTVSIALAQTRLLAYLEDSGVVDAELSRAERLHLVQQRTQSQIDEQEQLASGDLSGRANATQLSVPAWLIFGMFFVVLPMADGFQREQQSGTLPRLRCPLAEVGDLLVKVEGSHASGDLYLALVAVEPHWPEQPLLQVRSSAAMVQLRDIASGRYAIQLFQDNKGNGQLDHSRRGIPLEPVGFSGNPPLVNGKPAPLDCLFVHGEVDTQLSIRLHSAKAKP